MSFRNLLASTLALLLATMPGIVRGQEPTGDATCSIDTPAPKSYTRASLRTSAGEEVPGFFVTDAAMVAVDAKINRCIDLAARCGVDLAVEKGKTSISSLRVKTIVYSIILAAALGFSAGYVVAR